jgi:hypothetical protein
VLSVVPPSKFKEEHTQKLIHKMIEKRGFFRKKPLEDIIHKSMLWMPYYRIRYNYSLFEKEPIQKHGETALNAMFCGCVKNEKELFMLFKPNYLKYKIISYSPQSEEIVGSTTSINFDRILRDFLQRLNEVKEEANEFRSELKKIRTQIRRQSMMLPIGKDLTDKEKRLSEKVARLDAVRNIIGICLNISEDARTIKVSGHNVFYYPTLVVTLKHKENGAERYLIVDLVESGLIRKHLSYDIGLTELCNKNSACREIIASTIA